MPALPGTRLGPYDVLAPIGAGGMGEVYRARDSRLGRDVAVKVLPPPLVDAPDALARFEREARAVAALNHPNILALYDVGREGPIAYAVTELLEGETLRSRIAAGPIPPRRALDFVAQIARGLAAAHDRGIIHRDVKPENLFLTTDSRVKILDFGVATSAGALDGTTQASAAALTQPGMVVGTPAYMAPEQLTAQPATARTDLFALGLVAHEMLTGTHPFQRATSADTSMAILRDDPAPLGRVGSTLPPGATAILTRCLEKAPGDRPGSARDLAFYFDALASASDATHTFAAAGGGPAPAVARRVLIASLALLLALVLVVTGYAGLLAQRAAGASIDADLAHAGRLVHRVQQERLARLLLTAELLASFPELKALFDTDAATVRDFLLAYQTSHPGTPTLMALAPRGDVLARTDTAGPSPPAPGDTWADTLVTRTGEPSVVEIEGRLYHAASAVSAAGGTVFGYVVAAMPVDQTFAQALSEATQDEIVLLSTGVLASTLRGSQTPWRSLQAWREQGGRSDGAAEVSIGTRRFAAREVPLSSGPDLSVVVAKSRDEAAAPFRDLQRAALVAGLAGAALAAAAAWWIARDLKRTLSGATSDQRL